jgi:L-fucose mutarotase
VLAGIHPILNGELLCQLDAMGHSDSVGVVDAHFPASRLASRFIDLPALSAPAVVAAIRTVLPLDEPRTVVLMATADNTVVEVHRELLAAAAIPLSDAMFLDRVGFYDRAATAFLIVRTGEIRTYGNALLAKGVVAAAVSEWGAA